MKYLLSVLLFLGFIFFSIPGFAADVSNDDDSFNLQNQTVNIVNQALIPEIVRQDASNQATLTSETKVNIVKSFVQDLSCFLSPVLNLLGIKTYCEFNLSVGENTNQYAAGSKILGQTSIPANMELISAKKDEDLGYPGKEDIGNEKLNQLSENLGTTTGFFRNDQPPLSDYDACIQKRMKEFNFDLNGKLFEQDQRSADIYCSKQVYCQGSYPNDICPFEPPTL